MKTAILTDSTAYLPKEIREKHHIYMIPLAVNFAHETYQEEIDLTAAQFYEKLREKNELPTTSQPPIGSFLDMFETLARDYDAVISIHLSSGISGTYQGAVTAGNMVETIKVYPYDSEMSCMAQGFYALEAASLACDGKTPEEIIQRLDEMKQSMKAYFMVDDLTNLQRGGRLSSAQAIVGSLLKVKPILHFVDKKIVPYEKIRTRKKALNRLLELFGEDAARKIPMRAAIIHANRKEEAEHLKEELREKYPHVEFDISYFGPVIGTHLGEGAIGIVWYVK